jgi:hypothetical protein
MVDLVYLFLRKFQGKRSTMRTHRADHKDVHLKEEATTSLCLAGKCTKRKEIDGVEEAKSFIEER